MINPVIRMDNLQLRRRMKEILDVVHHDLHDIEENLDDNPGDEHLLKEAALAVAVIKKLENPKCKPEWFTQQETTYLVHTLLYWKRG